MDPDLVQRAQRGDHVAFDALVDATIGRIDDGDTVLYTLVTPNPGDPYGDRHIWRMSLTGDSPQLTAGGLVGSHPEPRPMP